MKSIQHTHPDIATYRHPTKNGKLTPNDVTQGSQKKVWWKAKCSHEW
ncbi:zinc-ribbon domain-containing protein [Bacillus thuringiensis]|nr:zinc-ribbon domain-containing protein [Bacillus thuringiensis]